MVFTRNLCADSTSDFNCPFTLDPELQLLMNLLHKAITRISLVRFENLLIMVSNGFDSTTKGVEFNTESASTVQVARILADDNSSFKSLLI
ncbi:hypothetical protein TNCT_263941 [Trichonephila clavata]|uniref:Uncharacterized protein n=1 Tax=Trichonephila clavata TaxID=2740835 RepID=A0A8X6GWG4_TRICU|nr:hypothetical protein TNCT_263941 [Trichonephila clavata]